MSEWFFWGSFVLLGHHYVFYPIIVLLLSKLAMKSTSGTLPQDGKLPRVSLVIAAYNEEKVIGRKLENSLGLDYPVKLLEVIVVSDGSSDNTSSIVEQYRDCGVISLHDPERRGKTAALNRGVAESQGEIVLFSDANNDFNLFAIRALVRNFADPDVGGVCGVKRIRDARERESSVGDSLYWRYESAIKLAESRLGSITNGDGEIFAIRRELYEPMDETVINDDAELTLKIVQKGFRVLYEPGAESSEFASIDIRDDFFVKVRMVAGGFQTISRHAAFLLPPRNCFTGAFFSHKILRWTSPIWLMTLLISTAQLIQHSFYMLLLIAQIILYGLGAIGWAMRKHGKLPTIIYVPFYFCTMNVAAFFGMMRHFRRGQNVQWRKAQR